MATDDRTDALTRNGWTAAAPSPTGSATTVTASVTYTSKTLPGHQIEISQQGDAWQHFDANDLLIGHSRYQTKLSDHLHRHR